MNNEMLTKIVEDFESVVYKVLDATPEDILPYTPEEPVIDDERQSSQEDPSLSNVDPSLSNVDPSLSNVDEEEGNISQGESSQGEPPPTEVKFNELLNIDMDNNEQVQELQEIVNREQEKVINNLEEKNSIDEFLNF